MHTKSVFRQGIFPFEGQGLEKPAPIDVSNVMVVCPTCKNATRVGIHEKDVKGEIVRVRVCRREGCGQEIDK